MKQPVTPRFYFRPHSPSPFRVPAGVAESRGVIESLVKENKVMLFMKGNKMFPQCGFSNSAIQVCNHHRVLRDTAWRRVSRSN